MSPVAPALARPWSPRAWPFIALGLTLLAPAEALARTPLAAATAVEPVPKASPSAPVPKASPSAPVPKASHSAPVPKASHSAPVPKASPDHGLSGPLEVEAAIAVALAQNPGLDAARHRVRGQELLAEAERKPAAPTLSLDMWQIPLAKPWALDQSPMIMLALRQPIPPAGLLRRRAAARRHAASAEHADRDALAQTLALAVRHAFIDYAAASERRDLHVEHQQVSERVLQLARARQSVSGTLLDIARAETEAARAHADVATDATTIDAARTRLNSLMARPPDAPLGPPVPLPPETAAADASTLIARAQAERPEQRAAAARRDAAAMELQAARREAVMPAADLGLAFFPATRAMTYNGYGLLVNVSLPWLSGQGRKRRDAQAELAAAAQGDLAEARLQIAREVAEALAAAQSAAQRWQTLRGAALPASQRAREVALSGYEVGRADLLAMLATEGAYVEISLEIIDAKSALDHALADLERASGSPLPRAPLLPADSPHAGARP